MIGVSVPLPIKNINLYLYIFAPSFIFAWSILKTILFGLSK
jgi:hypothetical protein